MDFLYGELNKLVEKQVYQGKNTDTASVDVDNIDSTISVNVNLDKVASREYVENRTKDLVGPAGESAYQIAVDNGFIGTEEEWLASLSSVTKTSIQNALGYVPESESNKVEDYNPGSIYTNKQFLSATATENLLSQSHNIVAVDVTYDDGSSETFEIWANKR